MNTQSSAIPAWTNEGRPASRRFLALWFPFLPVDRLGRGEPPRRGTRDKPPFALTEKVRGAIRLAAVCPRAVTFGLGPGLALADARARVPELEVAEHEPAADRRWLEQLADGCERFTPLVTIDLPDQLILDITGCAHLFGGEAGLIGKVTDHFGAFTRHLRHGVAGSPEAAWALARYARGTATDAERMLRSLSIDALRLEEEARAALGRAGLKTIGDLIDRPTSPISARFGEAATAALARLLGRADSRITPRRKPPALWFERRFAEPLARTDDALSAIEDLAEEAAVALEKRHQGGRRFVARLFRTDGATRDLTIETGLPTRDPKLLMRLFRERVEALADPLDPGFGFDQIRFAVTIAETLGTTQLPLKGGAINEEAMAALIDRLGTRLGAARIRRFSARDTHVPEQGVLSLPATEKPRGLAPWPTREPGEPPARPIHLFDPPQQIETVALMPDGPPRRFRWRRVLHEVRRSEGPERIAPPWWRHAPDEGLTRDYYRVEDARGRRFWIFRHGLYERESNAPRWYIHGLFT